MMLREDVLWLIPSLFIAIYQVGVIWRGLPKFDQQDTEITGGYSERQLVWLDNGTYIVYGLFILQLSFPIFEITHNGLGIFFLRIVGYLLVVSGFVISYISLKELGANWTGMGNYRIKKGQKLVTTGIYSYLRHPIYFSAMIEMVGYELIAGSWLFLPLFLFVFLAIKKHIENEERLLEIKYGLKYFSYKKKTKAFILFIY